MNLSDFLGKVTFFGKWRREGGRMPRLHTDVNSLIWKVCSHRGCSHSETRPMKRTEPCTGPQLGKCEQCKAFCAFILMLEQLPTLHSCCESELWAQTWTGEEGPGEDEGWKKTESCLQPYQQPSDHPQLRSPRNESSAGLNPLTKLSQWLRGRVARCTVPTCSGVRDTLYCTLKKQRFKKKKKKKAGGNGEHKGLNHQWVRKKWQAGTWTDVGGV